MKKLLFLLCLILILAIPLIPGCDLFARQLPVVNSFDANPPSISADSSSTLTWNISGAASVSIDQGIGNVALTGSRAVAPSTTTTYTLTATNASGSITATCQVMVAGTPSTPSTPSVAGQPVVITFTANPSVIAYGNSSTLTWNVSNATSVTIDPGVGTFASSGSTVVMPAVTTIYALTASNAAGSTTSMAQVTVSSSGYTPTPEPTPATFSVLGVTTTVEPSTFTGCPKNFSCSAVITANGAGTVTYRWERSDGGSSSTQTVVFATAGSQMVSTGWPREVGGSYWVRVRTLSPNEILSNQASFTLNCITAEEPTPELTIFQVQNVSLNVTPTSYNGPCPSQFTCSVTITVNGPGTVTYRWERSDGMSAIQSMIFTAAGSKTATTGWNPPTQYPWVRVRTLSPNEKVSTQWTVENLCLE
jgi:hypothetical protein